MMAKVLHGKSPGQSGYCSTVLLCSTFSLVTHMRTKTTKNSYYASRLSRIDRMSEKVLQVLQSTTIAGQRVFLS